MPLIIFPLCNQIHTTASQTGQFWRLIFVSFILRESWILFFWFPSHRFNSEGKSWNKPWLWGIPRPNPDTSSQSDNTSTVWATRISSLLPHCFLHSVCVFVRVCEWVCVSLCFSHCDPRPNHTQPFRGLLFLTQLVTVLCLLIYFKITNPVAIFLILNADL